MPGVVPEQQQDVTARRSRTTVEVGVAISTLDRPDALARCLESLASGSTLPAEVVIVDQSATSTARAVVEAATSLPSMRHVPHDRRGLGAAQNLAVATTTMPVVAVLDDDCVAHPEWIARIAAHLDSGLPLHFVAGRVLPLGDAAYLVPVSSRASTVRRDFRTRARPWDVGSGNNFAFRREWFERVGGCDERLGPGSPGRGAVDIDLFYRLLRAGASVAYEPDLVVYHERKSRRERVERRIPYGHGMGASCTFRVREGDRYGLRVLTTWLVFRGRLLAKSLLRRRWWAAYEELLILGGTVLGIGHALVASGHGKR